MSVFECVDGGCCWSFEWFVVEGFDVVFDFVDEFFEVVVVFEN